MLANPPPAYVAGQQSASSQCLPVPATADLGIKAPGDSVDKEINRQIETRFTDVLLCTTCFCLLALYEWIGYLGHIPRQPIPMSCVAAVAVAFTAWRFVVTRKHHFAARNLCGGNQDVFQAVTRREGHGGRVYVKSGRPCARTESY